MALEMQFQQNAAADSMIRSASVEWSILNIVSVYARSALRDAILDSIEGRQPDRPLAGILSNCADTVPVDHCIMLGLPRGSTVAQAARLVRKT